MIENKTESSPVQSPTLQSDSKRRSMHDSSGNLTSSCEQIQFKSTEKLYLKSVDWNYRLDCTACLLSVEGVTVSYDSTTETVPFSVELTLILDRTILYAQGGGQPSDHGIVVLTSSKNNIALSIKITKVVLDCTNIIRHKGTLHQVESLSENNVNCNELFSIIDQKGTIKAVETSEFNELKMTRWELALKLLQEFQCNPTPSQLDEVVYVFVDAQLRLLHSECHTAGHLVDAAMQRCGLNLVAGKGYHFLDGPYVEYIGKVETNNKDELLRQLQQAFSNLVQEAIETRIEFVDPELAAVLCSGGKYDDGDRDQVEMMQGYADPITGLVRIATIADVSGLCGGTHVANTSQLTAWEISGLKIKKGTSVRVKYRQRTT